MLVADWGGDPAGLDAAEVLAAAGNEVTLAVAAVTVGESVHQYRRNLYLQRLYRAGVTILPHHELTGSATGRDPVAQRLRTRARDPGAHRRPRARARPRPGGRAGTGPPRGRLPGRGGRRLPLAALARGGRARGCACRPARLSYALRRFLTVRSKKPRRYHVIVPELPSDIRELKRPRRPLRRGGGLSPRTADRRARLDRLRRGRRAAREGARGRLLDAQHAHRARRPRPLHARTGRARGGGRQGDERARLRRRRPRPEGAARDRDAAAGRRNGSPRSSAASTARHGP